MSSNAKMYDTTSENVIGLIIHIIIYRSCISFLSNIPMMCPIQTHFKSGFREPLPLGYKIFVAYCNYSNTTECKIYYFLKLEQSSTNRTTNKYYGIVEFTMAVMWSHQRLGKNRYPILFHFSTLKMEARFSSKTSIPIFQTTVWHIPEGYRLIIHHMSTPGLIIL